MKTYIVNVMILTSGLETHCKVLVDATNEAQARFRAVCEFRHDEANLIDAKNMICHDTEFSIYAQHARLVSIDHIKILREYLS